MLGPGLGGRREAEPGADLDEAAREQLLGLGLGHVVGDEDVLADHPVDAAGDRGVRVVELERVDDADDLVEVPARRVRVLREVLDVLVRVGDDDEGRGEEGSS